MIKGRALGWRLCTQKGEVAAVTTFHCYSVQQPLAWNPNLQYTNQSNSNLHIAPFLKISRHIAGKDAERHNHKMFQLYITLTDIYLQNDNHVIYVGFLCIQFCMYTASTVLQKLQRTQQRCSDCGTKSKLTMSSRFIVGLNKYEKKGDRMRNRKR